MGRGPIDGLLSPHPLGERLPALYQEDDLALRLVAALDQVLAPLLSTLDNLEAYLDPELAPGDFLLWLAGWLGVAVDESWPAGQVRALVREASDLHRTRGTAAGLRDYVRLLTGAYVEVDETGGTAYATTPDAEPPGSPGFVMVVRLRPDPALPPPDPARLHELVAAAKPAHVSHRIEIL